MNFTNYRQQSLAMAFLILSSILTTGAASAQNNIDSGRWCVHFQETTIGQYHPDFQAKYSGQNSQPNIGEPMRISVTSTLFLGCRLWQGAELYFNPELSGGRGVGKTQGIAGFPNGETYRIGDPEPVIAPVRFFLRQSFSLNRKDSSKLIFTAGKFSVTDIFDNNSYSHDPRTQFLNWSIMSAGAWDYPADTKGYTYGLAGELNMQRWSLKAGITMVPTTANGPEFDMNIGKAHSLSLEFDHNIKINDRPGIVRLVGFYTEAHMGNYAMATYDTVYHHDIALTRAYGRNKWGFVLNAEQEINHNTGIFLRASYNDGHNETWAFTEIDGSVCLGILWKGSAWKRDIDRLGIAVVANGISNDHKNYLAAGGYGFIIGDGHLNYAEEHILEVFYNYRIGNYLFMSPDYQFVLSPAYNKDRGPIHLFALRAHVEF